MCASAELSGSHELHCRIHWDGAQWLCTNKVMLVECAQHDYV